VTFLAKPNYQFEKRQKELAKKNKKEEKRRQKSSGADESAPAGSQNSIDSPGPDDVGSNQVMNAVQQ
jgi:hypothetical protein